MAQRAFLLLLVLFLGCKKTDSTLDDGGAPDPISGFSIDDKLVSAHQMVILKTQSKLSKKISGKIADKTVDIVSINDSTAGFIMPLVADGNYKLISDFGQVELAVRSTATVSKEQASSFLDQGVDMLRSLPEISEAEIEESINFNQEVMALFNTLTPQQQAEALSLYSANRKHIEQFINTLPREQFAIATSRNRQTDMSEKNKGILLAEAQPHNSLRAQSTSQSCFEMYPSDLVKQMDCQAGIINNQYQGLGRSLLEFTLFATYTGVAISLAPTTLGLSTITGSISAVMAVYILLAEIKPHTDLMRKNASNFLSRKWVLVKEKAAIAQQTFSSEEHVTIEDIYSQRALQESDAFPQNFTLLKRSKQAVDAMMNKFRAVLGTLPDYIGPEEEAIDSRKIIWSVSEISNPKVKLKEIKENRVAFKLESGDDETFTYKLSADYYGQKHDINVSAKYSITDSTSIYEKAVVGAWTVRNVDPNGNTYSMTIQPGGTAVYRTSEGAEYPSRWQIRKQNGRYFLREYGFWHSAFDEYRTYDTSLPNVALSYPVRSFNVYTHFISLGQEPNLALVYSR